MARPRLPEEERHENRIAVYLDEDDNLLLRILARKKGIPVAVLARSLIRSRLQALMVSGELTVSGKAARG